MSVLAVFLIHPLWTVLRTQHDQGGLGPCPQGAPSPEVTDLLWNGDSIKVSSELGVGEGCGKGFLKKGKFLSGNDLE